MCCRVCDNSGILNKTCVVLFFLLTFTVIGCRNKVERSGYYKVNKYRQKKKRS